MRRLSYFEKEKLRVMLDKFDLRTNPMLPAGIYDCFHADNTQIITEEIQTDIWTHKPGMDFDKLLDVKYLNIYDNVIVPEFMDKMKEIFP